MATGAARLITCGSARGQGWQLRWVVVLIAGLLLSCSQSPSGDVKQAGDAAVRSMAEPLDITEPDVTALGRLRYRGGLSLTSDDKRFGGLSGLRILGDGDRFLAVSDVGYWISGRLRYDSSGSLAGVEAVHLEPMRRLNGEIMRWGLESDAEDLTATPEGLVVSFERDHRLWLYAHPQSRPLPLAAPEGLGQQPSNGGVEALARLADGRLIAISEHLERDGGVQAWLQTADGRWEAFTWRTSQGFRPTGAAGLANGDLVVLERRFPPIGARVRLAQADAIAPGATVEGREIARLEGSTTVDNMEGIAVRQSSDGRLWIYLISDDNFSPLQRNLLMMFELDGPEE